MNDYSRGYNYLGRKEKESNFPKIFIGIVTSIVAIVISSLCLFGLLGSFLIGYFAK